MKILLEKSDENHKLTVVDIIKELENYGISAERKSIYSDIEYLKDFGLDIIVERRKSNHYYIGTREFQIPELKILVDVVQASKFITHKKSEELIKKLEKLTSIYEAKKLHRHVIVSDRVKTMNESIYYNIDAINKAINENKIMNFKYLDYTLEKIVKAKNNGQRYVVAPCNLAWSEEKYYLIAYHQGYKEIRTYRVDKMMDIEITDEAIPQIQELENFNIAKYSKQVFKMFGGETETLKIEFNNSLINVVIDKFGKDVIICDKIKSSFIIIVEVAATDTFFGWLFMFGEKAKILEPSYVVEKFKKRLDSTINQY